MNIPQTTELLNCEAKTNRTEKRNNYTIKVGDFNTSFSTIDRIDRKSSRI